MLKAILKNRSTRVLTILFLIIVGISAFFLVFGYKNQLNLLEKQRLERLEAIAATIATQLSGEDHLLMVETMMKQMDAPKPFQNEYYIKLNKQLSKTQATNKLESPVYTLFYHSDRATFCYGARSDSNYYLFDEYLKFPKDLVQKMNEGGILPKYENKNGTWISAFHPIKTKQGETVAIIEVDEEFSVFRAYANQKLYKFIGAGSAGILLISGFLFPFLRQILDRDTQMIVDLANQKKELEILNKDTAASISYASLLQRVLMPEPEDLKRQLKDVFVFYKPKDIISGDFYWSFESNNSVYIALADGTGHGVPGAMLSVMGITVLDSILASNPEINPDQLLMKLDLEITKMMSSSNRKNTRSDGMDIGICKIDKKEKKVSFSGAMIDLYCVSETGEKMQIRGEHFPIGGGGLYQKTTIETQMVENPFKGTFYLFSDGFQDQFGGSKGKKYGKIKLLEFLSSIEHLSAEEQSNRIKIELIDWMKNRDQVDDISILGFKVGNL